MNEEDLKKQYYGYLNDNLDVINSFEKYRRFLLFKTLFVSFLFFLCALIVVCIISLMILNSKYNPFLFPILLFLLYVLLLKSITGIILADRNYQQKFNEKIMPLILAPVANFKNWPKNKNTDSIINSNLFQNFDTQEDCCCVFGYYKTTSLTISDTKLTLPVRASEKPDIFKGIIIQAELERNIKNHVILISKNERKNNKFSYFKTNVDEIDENLYTFIKTQSKINFLSQQFWKMIEKIAIVYSAKSFAFSYHDNTVLIAMKQRKALPFGCIFKSLLTLKNYDEYIEKFIVIFELIDFIMTEN